MTRVTTAFSGVSGGTKDYQTPSSSPKSKLQSEHVSQCCGSVKFWIILISWELASSLKKSRCCTENPSKSVTKNPRVSLAKKIYEQEIPHSSFNCGRVRIMEGSVARSGSVTPTYGSGSRTLRFTVICRNFGSLRCVPKFRVLAVLSASTACLNRNGTPMFRI